MSDYRILHADVLDGLRSLPYASVHCVVTSPPYYGLRSYGIDGQLGLEATPEAYLERMVEVFREVRRVLRPDGTAWVNMGDSYAGSWGNYGARDGKQRTVSEERYERPGYDNHKSRPPASYTGPGLPKPKDLLMMPARLALALQADGWWLRSDIIWCKRAPMPESVTDRPTSAHEHIFLLNKAERYFYDADAVRLELAPATIERERSGYSHAFASQFRGSPIDERHPNGKVTEAVSNRAGRNLWNYWLLSPEPLAMAHFATFPTEIPRRAILAGTSERGVCPECGAPWKRVVERSGGTTGNGWHDHTDDLGLGQRKPKEPIPYKRESTGWAPTCRHAHTDTIPATVLDPFAGAGTTLLVAQRLGRRSVGIELNAEYVQMAHKRIQGDEKAMNMHMDLREATV